ncbi:MAG: methyltransferase domain-containing protein [Pseudomonadota bacterium]
MTETYTLGYDDIALDFVARRRLDANAAFLIPYLKPGTVVLDCGCGPGTVTLDIAERIGEGTVVGVDMSESQVRNGMRRAARRALRNVSFRQGNAYALPFADASFDVVFSHALLEHLSDPGKALREFRRVLKPEGLLGACTPDWSGFLYSPATRALLDAIKAYVELQARNGGDANIGHKLRDYLVAAGFEDVRSTARYENYDPLSVIGDLVAWQLERDGQRDHAAAMRAWAAQPGGMFAQAWVSCIGRRPPA